MAICVVESLKLKWNNLLYPLGLETDVVQQLFQDLIEAYSSRDRHYHTAHHIEQMLEIVENERTLANNSLSLRLAVWFHDVVYRSRSKDNEEKSTFYAESKLEQLGLSRSIINQVKDLIMATKTHQDFSNDYDTKILLDADLSILGSSSLEYENYASAIRREYGWVCDVDYRKGREKVLHSFLERPEIYCTQKMFLDRETKARQNIESEIRMLRL